MFPLWTWKFACGHTYQIEMYDPAFETHSEFFGKPTVLMHEHQCSSCCDDRKELIKAIHSELKVEV